MVVGIKLLQDKTPAVSVPKIQVSNKLKENSNSSQHYQPLSLLRATHTNRQHYQLTHIKSMLEQVEKLNFHLMGNFDILKLVSVLHPNGKLKYWKLSCNEICQKKIQIRNSKMKILISNQNEDCHLELRFWNQMSLHFVFLTDKPKWHFMLKQKLSFCIKMSVQNEKGLFQHDLMELYQKFTFSPRKISISVTPFVWGRKIPYAKFQPALLSILQCVWIAFYLLNFESFLTFQTIKVKKLMLKFQKQN